MNDNIEVTSATELTDVGVREVLGLLLDRLGLDIEVEYGDVDRVRLVERQP